MSDSLLGHYEKELAFIRQSAAEFAARHPKIAGRLQLGAEELEDPLVERLISAFAYLNAHVQQRLDDDFPELTNALLGVLYPHYQRPIPSMSIACFEPDAGLDSTNHIPAGTLLRTEAFNGESCLFRTAYPVDLHPLEIASARMMLRPFIAPASNTVSGADGVIHLSLKTVNPQLTMAEAAPDSIRIHLRGQAQNTLPLYEQLLNHCVRVVVAASETDEHPTLLPGSAIRAVGFEREESLLPMPDTALPGYQLLTDYFVFPDKFMFVEVEGLGRVCADMNSSEIHLYFYLEDPRGDMERQISARSFALACTPVVNLFETPADPILMTEERSSYHVTPDSRRVDSMEIYSIDGVQGIDQDERRVNYHPFYGRSHASEDRSRYWHMTRREVIEGEHHNERASEVDISLVDLEFNPANPVLRALDIQLTCFNRNTPAKLPFSAGRLKLKMAEGDAPVRDIYCVTAPTQTLRPALRKNAYWRLVSHLNLNHLSLGGGDKDSAEPLKEVLRLYDFRDSASTRTAINALRNIRTRTISAPITVDGRSTLCRGLEVILEFDTMMLAGGSAFLYASVLERFLAVYCSINAFVRVIARTTQREGDLKKWPPRSGNRTLL